MTKAKVDNNVVRSLYEIDLKTPTQISIELGITKSRVYQILDTLKIERRPICRPEHDDLSKLIHKLYTVDKLTKREIVKATGKHITTVLKHLTTLKLITPTPKNPKCHIEKSVLFDLYIKQRLPASKIAELYNITESCVYGKLKKFDLKNGVRNKVFIEEEDLRRMFIEDGMAASEIAKIFDLNVQTVYSKLNKYKIKRYTTIKVDSDRINELLGTGLNQREIANKLNISQSSVNIAINKKIKGRG